MIFLGILAVVLLLLLCSVRVRAAYRDTLRLRISYLFFSIQLLPPKKKKQKKQRKEKPAKKGAQKKPENLLKKLYQEKGLPGLLRFLQSLARLALDAGKAILRHVRVRRFSVNIAVATQDAAKTAVAYGMTCSVVYPAVSAFVGAANCPRYDVAVIADFQAEQPKVDAAVDCKIRVLFLLAAVLSALFRYMKARNSAKIETKEIQKGGAET